MSVGGTVVLSVEGSASSYQWKRNGSVIPGAEHAILTLTNLAAAQSGNYTVDVGNPAGVVTSAPATLTVTSGAEPGRIANFSIRSNAGSGAQTLIVGFAIDGAPKYSNPPGSVSLPAAVWTSTSTGPETPAGSVPVTTVSAFARFVTRFPPTFTTSVSARRFVPSIRTEMFPAVVDSAGVIVSIVGASRNPSPAATEPPAYYICPRG